MEKEPKSRLLGPMLPLLGLVLAPSPTYPFVTFFFNTTFYQNKKFILHYLKL